MGEFSTSALIGGLLFGTIGFVAFAYGKKMGYFRTMIIGVGLMAFPYFIRNTVYLFVVGVVLTAALYFFRD